MAKTEPTNPNAASPTGATAGESQPQPTGMPTHSVPADGMPAWVAPDPARPPVLSLPPGLDLVVDQRSGDWARVRAQNGWSGWVDGRSLVVRRQTAAAPQPVGAPAQYQPMAAAARRRSGIPIVIGVAALVVLVVGALAVGAFVVTQHQHAASPSGGTSTPGPSAQVVPDDGGWTGSSDSGLLLVTFTVTGGSRVSNLQADFTDPDGTHYVWSCSSADVLSGTFMITQFTGGSGATLALGGHFASPDSLTGVYDVSNGSGLMIYSGSWSAAPNYSEVPARGLAG